MIRAARALAAARRACTPHARLHLRKQIPLAGGLAGGSADAAATLVACDALWGTGLSAATSWPGSPPTLGSDVPFLVLRRHRAGHRPGRGGQPGAGPRPHLALGGRDRRRRPVHPEVYRELDRLRGRRRRRRRRWRSTDELLAALRQRDPTVLGRGARQRPAGGRALAAPGAAPTRSTPATTAGALAGLVSGSGPTCVFLARDAGHADERRRRRCASRGVCRAARTAHGPVPGARVALTSPMANIVNLDRVSKGYGAAGTLLTDVSLGLDDADRIGVVGLNGAGKSTLLRLLTKAEEPDAGRVTHRRDLRVAALPQTLDLAADGHRARRGARHRLAAERRSAPSTSGPATPGVRAILDGLGMPDLGLDAPVGPMSGGERRRVALAALLVRAGRPADPRRAHQPPRRRRRRLAGPAPARPPRRAGRGHPRPVVPRRGLHRTWEVADQTVRAYEGGYAAWTLARAERRAGRRRDRGPPAEPAPQGDRLAAPRPAGPHLQAAVPHRRGQRAHRRRAAGRATRCRCSGWPPPGSASRSTTWQDVTLHAGDRSRSSTRRRPGRSAPATGSRIVGANGAGKTTLLRLLAGHQPARRRAAAAPARPCGRRSCPRSWPSCPAQLRVLEAVEEVARRVKLGDRELSAAQLAEVFGFTDRRLWTPVGDLSGGERRRLQMLRLLAGEPNVLLLDEPTNDLDTDTLASLEDLLDSWPGTMVVASHDRYLVERVCDTVYGMFGDGRLIAPARRRRRVPRPATADRAGAPAPASAPSSTAPAAGATRPAVARPRSAGREEGAGPARAAGRQAGPAGGGAARAAGRPTPPTTRRSPTLDAELRAVAGRAGGGSRRRGWTLRRSRVADVAARPGGVAGCGARPDARQSSATPRSPRWRRDMVAHPRQPPAAAALPGAGRR